MFSFPAKFPTKYINVVIYGLVTAFQGLVSFSLVPLVLRSSGQTVFVQWALLEPFLIYGPTIALLGINFGLLKLIGADKLSPRQALRYIFGPAAYQLSAFFCVSLLLAYAVTRHVAISGLISLLVVAEAMFVLYQSALRGGNLAFPFALGVLAKSGAIISVFACFYVFGKTDVTLLQIVFIFMLGSVLGLTASRLTLHITVPHGAFGSDAAIFRSARMYGFPIMISSVIAGALIVADRYVLNHVGSVSETARYVAIVKLAGVISMASAPLAMWFPVARYKHVGDSDGGRAFFSEVLLGAYALYLLAAGAMFILGPSIFVHFAPGLKWNDGVAALLLLSAVAAGLCVPVNIGLLNEGRTRYLPISLGLVFAIELTLLCALAPLLGGLGAALSLFLAQVTNLSLIFFISQKFHPLKWPLRRLCIITLSFFPIVAAASRIQPLIVSFIVFVLAHVAVCFVIVTRPSRAE